MYSKLSKLTLTFKVKLFKQSQLKIEYKTCKVYGEPKDI